ncbi:Ribosomal protein S18 acetylase RimI [Burkholderia sp. D7]|nr:Ribosomal protein S18 acetylase RimI [Burkholderia sp. D7]
MSASLPTASRSVRTSGRGSSFNDLIGSMKGASTHLFCVQLPPAEARTVNRQLEQTPDMTEAIHVRPVELSDFAAWKPLWDGYNAFYGRHGETALQDEITRMTWSRFFDAYEPMHALVAESAGELIGLTHFLFHRSTIQLGPSCYLQDLFTAEAARGKGVGRKLINGVYQHAQNSGVERVYWHTRETNTTAMQLYDKVAEKQGSVVYRKHFQVQAIWPAGSPHQVV